MPQEVLHVKCSIADCDSPVRSAGLCGLHYQRKRIHGDPLAPRLTQKLLIPPGTRFGKLVVIEEAASLERGYRHVRRMVCRCDCGDTTVAFLSALRCGNTTTCGCGSREALIRSRFKHGHALAGHHSPEYYIWRAMIQRCESEKCADYPDYGGRGIRVCPRWRTSFVDFLADMGPRPEKKLSLDRENNDGNYEPDNCRWATQKQQANNRRKRRPRVTSEMSV